MRGRRRLYSAFLLSTVFLLLLSWVNKHRLLPGSQVRDLSICTTAILRRHWCHHAAGVGWHDILVFCGGALAS